MYVSLRGIGQQSFEVLKHTLVGFLWRSLTPTSVLAQLSFGRGQQCPSKAILMAMAVGGVDKVFSDDAACHLQARHVVIEL